MDVRPLEIIEKVQPYVVDIERIPTEIRVPEPKEVESKRKVLEVEKTKRLLDQRA